MSIIKVVGDSIVEVLLTHFSVLMKLLQRQLVLKLISHIGIGACIKRYEFD